MYHPFQRPCSLDRKRPLVTQLSRGRCTILFRDPVPLTGKDLLSHSSPVEDGCTILLRDPCSLDRKRPLVAQLSRGRCTILSRDACSAGTDIFSHSSSLKSPPSLADPCPRCTMSASRCSNTMTNGLTRGNKISMKLPREWYAGRTWIAYCMWGQAVQFCRTGKHMKLRRGGMQAYKTSRRISKIGRVPETQWAKVAE